MKIDGKKIADKILEELKTKVIQLWNKNIFPKLAIILVGNDPASAAYVRQKELRAKEIGIKTLIKKMSAKTSESALLEAIEQLNNDINVHGIIVQQPLPQQINLENIINSIDPKKDVDGFHPKSKFQMPIALAVLKILEEVYAHTLKVQSQFINWLKNKRMVVIGKGKTGGMPIINCLRKLGIEPVIIGSRTKNPESITRTADIIISAVGKPNVLRPEMIKRGVTLIGIGISRGESAKLMGDYDWKDVENIASFYTPTPGGVGPVDVAMLLRNLVSAASL